MNHLAVGDCEHCREGLIAQPANTLSSFGLVLAGASALRLRERARPIEGSVACCSIAAGLGSVAFHGPGGRVSKLLHDGGLVALLATISVADLTDIAHREPGPLLSGAIGVAGFVVAASRWGGPAQVIVGTIAVCSEVVRVTRSATPRSSEDRLLAPLALSGAAAHLLGRTGGPLCDPESLVQPHAYWHSATAAIVWLRGRSLDRRQRAAHEGPPETRSFP